MAMLRFRDSLTNARLLESDFWRFSSLLLAASYILYCTKLLSILALRDLILAMSVRC